MEPTPDPQPFSVPAPPAAAGTANDERAVADEPEVGQLTAGWGTVFWIGWMLIAASFVAIWYSSRLIGLSTWWLGPESDPRLILVNLLPITVPFALGVAGFKALRRLPWWGMAGAAFVAFVAAFDISRVPGYAVIEFGLAGAGLCISLASFAGMYRVAEQ